MPSPLFPPGTLSHHTFEDCVDDKGTLEAEESVVNAQNPTAELRRTMFVYLGQVVA